MGKTKSINHIVGVLSLLACGAMYQMYNWQTEVEKNSKKREILYAKIKVDFAKDEIKKRLYNTKQLMKNPLLDYTPAIMELESSKKELLNTTYESQLIKIITDLKQDNKKELSKSEHKKNLDDVSRLYISLSK